jgi:hypothetical protein
MSYSFDKQTDRWSELADEYQSMSDELAELDTDDVFIPVSNFDEYEVL